MRNKAAVKLLGRTHSCLMCSMMKSCSCWLVMLVRFAARPSHSDCADVQVRLSAEKKYSEPLYPIHSANTHKRHTKDVRNHWNCTGRLRTVHSILHLSLRLQLRYRWLLTLGCDRAHPTACQKHQSKTDSLHFELFEFRIRYTARNSNTYVPLAHGSLIIFAQIWLP